MSNKKRWGLLPKCEVGAWGCKDYYRGRCKRLESCSYKEKNKKEE